jgi:hypothetical protein
MRDYPTRKVTNLVVSIVAVDTATEMFGMDPIGELRKNQFSSEHDASLASWLLWKMTKRSSNRSHPLFMRMWFSFRDLQPTPFAVTG